VQHLGRLQSPLRHDLSLTILTYFCHVKIIPKIGVITPDKAEFFAQYWLFQVLRISIWEIKRGNVHKSERLAAHTCCLSLDYIARTTFYVKSRQKNVTKKNSRTPNGTSGCGVINQSSLLGDRE
jgi:hypothetical protein